MGSLGIPGELVRNGTPRPQPRPAEYGSAFYHNSQVLCVFIKVGEAGLDSPCDFSNPSTHLKRPLPSFIIYPLSNLSQLTMILLAYHQYVWLEYKHLEDKDHK